MRGDNQLLARTRDEITHDGCLDVNRLHVSLSQNAVRVANRLRSELFYFAMRTFFRLGEVSAALPKEDGTNWRLLIYEPAYCAMALATSRVESLPPISYVRTLPSAITRAMAASRRVARSVSLSQSNISFTVKSIAIGLTLYWPVYFGAEPCVGSNTAYLSPRLALGANPSPPTRPAHKSLTMSPNIFSATSTE